MQNHEIDYKIYGSELQCVEVELDPNETVIAEPGAMMYMDSNMKMETIFGDGRNQGGFMGKVFSAGKRVLTGESLFLTAFTHVGSGKKHVSFAAPYPGKIIAINLSEVGGKFICQKNAFLAAAKGVTINVEFNRKIGVGLFGGEGFIMQRLEGDGMAFVHAGGTIVEKTLAPGESLKVDTGCLVGFTQGISYNIEYVGGIKNALFGGEGLFFATLSGYGKVYIQSLPFSRLADTIISSAPKMGGKRRDEGSILGGLGDLLGGNNRYT
jgi:uncharacterized protein (TIGR00266 family)